MPDNVAPQIPTVSLQREGYPPRDAYEVFLFKSSLSFSALCAFLNYSAVVSG
jgi:hypothetical protein